MDSNTNDTEGVQIVLTGRMNLELREVAADRDERMPADMPDGVVAELYLLRESQSPVRVARRPFADRNQFDQTKVAIETKGTGISYSARFAEPGLDAAISVMVPWSAVPGEEWRGNGSNAPEDCAYVFIGKVVRFAHDFHPSNVEDLDVQATAHFHAILRGTAVEPIDRMALP
jgi:hypothetical protein